MIFHRHILYMNTCLFEMGVIILSTFNVVSCMFNTMDVFKVALFYVCMIVLFDESYGEGCNNDLTSKSAAVRLSNDLFCSYNKNVRPVMKQMTQTIVNTTFYILNVHMDEDWNFLQMSIQLVMYWNDEFLVWDSTKYDNIDHVHEDSTTVWIPDIISFYRGFNGADDNFLPQSMVMITSQGKVHYNHFVTFTTQCSANLDKWPFDSHNCTFIIGSYVYSNKFVNYSFPEGYFSMNYFKPNREWELGGITHTCNNIPFSNQYSTYVHCYLQYEINVVRFSSMYYSSVVIPAIVISLMRTFSFLMGHETSLRIFLLCLFFISDLLYLQFLDTKIPNNGEHLVYIVLLYRNSLILTAMALVISVISDKLYKYGTEDFPRNAPNWLKSLLTFLLNKRPIAMLINFNTQGAELLIENNVEEDSHNIQRDENAVFWKKLSIFLDRSSFIITLVFSLINFWIFIP